ncbi:hypothetical protein EYF80_021264 [Liparis tanakae]|uniref:Uncharacterized protein n=1 Tax=Liparis tanakae TaxID=230148 RepID=A0A4Z2HRL3_9TELE|nr:hypothetical protein EYF80_021264 [Liparis tanakae]
MSVADGCCVTLLLQRPQRALQHSLKVRHLTEDQSLTLTLFTDLLAANDLMTKAKTRLLPHLHHLLPLCRGEPLRLVQVDLGLVEPGADVSQVLIKDFHLVLHNAEPVLGPGVDTPPGLVEATELVLQRGLTALHQSLQAGAGLPQAGQLPLTALGLLQQALREQERLPVAALHLLATLETFSKGSDEMFGRLTLAHATSASMSAGMSPQLFFCWSSASDVVSHSSRAALSFWNF